MILLVKEKMHLKDIVERNFKLLSKKPNVKSHSYRCNHCPKEYVYHVSRMAQHIAECRSCPEFDKMQATTALAKSRRQKGQKRKVDDLSEDDDAASISSSVSNASFSGSVSSRDAAASTSKRSLNLDEFVDRRMSEHEQKYAQVLLATAIYASGAPLSLTQNEHWLKFLGFIRPAFHISSRHDISETILSGVYEAIKKEVDDLVANAKTVRIQVDGWSNLRREGILNIVLTTPKPVFFKSISVANKSEDAVYIAGKIREVIQEIGVDKVFSACTDNAEANLCAARILTKEFQDSKLVFYGCAAHILNLLMKDIGKMESTKSSISSAVSVINEVKNRRPLSSNFLELQKKPDAETTTLKNPGQTRFGSTVICLHSLLVNKHNLQALAINPALDKRWSKDIKTLVLSEEFWLRVAKLHAVLKPIVDWIKKLEGDTPCLSQVPQAFEKIENHLETELTNSLSLFSADDGITLRQCLEKRKNMCLRPVHYAANILDPTRKGCSLNSDQESTGIEFIYNIAPKFNLDPNQVMAEVTQFKMKEGIFAKEYVQNSASTISPANWWMAMCSSTLLSRIATEILKLSPTTAATERTFSTYSWIHSTKRNRLTVTRAGQITYIAHNIRLFDADKVDKILKGAIESAFRKRGEACLNEEKETAESGMESAGETDDPGDSDDSDADY